MTAEDIESQIREGGNWITHRCDFASAREYADAALRMYRAATDLAPAERATVARSLAWLFEQVHDVATSELLLREAAELER